jgi:hypothetical protein
MTYMIKRDGQEAGPFTFEQMKEMRASGEVDDAALFRRYGTEHWLAAVDLEDELTSGSTPPPLPSTGAPSSKFLGLTDWQQVGVIMAFSALAIAAYVIYGFASGEFSENIRRADERRAAEKLEEELEGAARAKAASSGLADGREIALAVASGKMARPLSVQIEKLAAERLKQSGADRLSVLEQQMWLYEYEGAFKRAYKREVAW